MSARDGTTGRRLARVGNALFLLVWLNAAALAFEVSALNWNAWTGDHQGGRYYFVSHGKRREVSRSLWRYSYGHELSVVVTLPLAVVVGAVCATAGRRNRPAPPRNPTGVSPEPRRPTAPGPEPPAPIAAAAGPARLAYDSPIVRLLAPGEKLLWVGRPRQGFMLRRWDGVMLLLLASWLMAVLQPALRSALLLAETSTFAPPGPVAIVLLLAGPALVAHRLRSDVRRRAATWYAVTDRRVLFVLTRRDVPSVIAVPYEEMAGVTLDARPDGSGNLTFARFEVDPYAANSQVIGGFTAPQRAMFEAIEAARDVCDLIAQARGTADRRPAAE